MSPPLPSRPGSSTSPRRRSRSCGRTSQRRSRRSGTCGTISPYGRLRVISSSRKPLGQVCPSGDVTARYHRRSGYMIAMNTTASASMNGSQARRLPFPFLVLRSPRRRKRRVICQRRTGVISLAGLRVGWIAETASMISQAVSRKLLKDFTIARNPAIGEPGGRAPRLRRSAWQRAYRSSSKRYPRPTRSHGRP